MWSLLDLEHCPMKSNKYAGSNYVTDVNESKQDFGVSLNLLCSSKSLLCKVYFYTLEGC